MTPYLTLLPTCLIRTLQGGGAIVLCRLPSEPALVYRTGKEQWSPPRGPDAQRRLKELREVFDHPITKVWHHDLAWKVVSVMDDHKVS